jgi:hypothetical protein
MAFSFPAPREFFADTDDIFSLSSYGDFCCSFDGFDTFSHRSRWS